MSKIIFSWKVDFNPCLITQRLWPGSAQALFSRIVCLWVDSKQGTFSSKETASPKRGSHSHVLLRPQGSEQATRLVHLLCAMSAKHSALRSISRFLGIDFTVVASRAMKCKPYTCMGARALYELIKHCKVQAVSTQQTVTPNWSKVSSMTRKAEKMKMGESVGGYTRTPTISTSCSAGEEIQGLGSARQVLYYWAPQPALALY